MRLCVRMKPYIQPFERTMALLELEQLTAAEAIPSGSEPQEFSVATDTSASALAGRLAYWEVVSGASGPIQTAQARLEARCALRGSPSHSADGALRMPRRRVLRYASHGLHEYRGKFFPQLVRALLNATALRNRPLVADPMMGSGTTLVEARLAGLRSVGLDLNPLSVLVARAKCSILAINPDELAELWQVAAAAFREPRARQLGYLRQLPADDQAYLRRWFSAEVLQRLDEVATFIQTVPRGPLSDVAWVTLSNILRRVSWQREADLRVRRDPSKSPADPVELFVSQLRETCDLMAASSLEIDRNRLGAASMDEGDARAIPAGWRDHLGLVDVVVTSPPYATALPYLDTDRLSLVYLQLLRRTDHGRRDRLMIGNREIGMRERHGYLADFELLRAKLPDSVSTLVDRISSLNNGAAVGFRRRNTASLLARYFLDMRTVLEHIHRLLRPGGMAHLVVGSNHTIAGGLRVEIPTAKLLDEIAATVGLSSERAIEMEMLPSRDLFRRNAGPTEAILSWRRPSAGELDDVTPILQRIGHRVDGERAPLAV